MARASALACALLGGLLAPPAHASCSDDAWADDYSPQRCQMVNGSAVVSCAVRNGSLCGMRMSSSFRVGFGVQSMEIKAAPGAGIATTFYMSTNGGLFDKFNSTPWVEVDWEILGLQAGNETRIWTNFFTGYAQEHNEMITVPFDVSEAYHTYALNISENSIEWLVDNVTYRTAGVRPYPDVAAAVHGELFQVFASVWGRSSGESPEGIPAFRAAMGLLDDNPNSFPVNASFRRVPGRRLEADSLEEEKHSPQS